MTAHQQNNKLATEAGLGSLIGTPDEKHIPEFHTNYAALRRLKIKLNPEQRIRYVKILAELAAKEPELAGMDPQYALHCASCRLQAQAVGRALKLW